MSTAHTIMSPVIEPIAPLWPAIRSDDHLHAGVRLRKTLDHVVITADWNTHAGEDVRLAIRDARDFYGIPVGFDGRSHLLAHGKVPQFRDLLAADDRPAVQWLASQLHNHSISDAKLLRSLSPTAPHAPSLIEESKLPPPVERSSHPTQMRGDRDTAAAHVSAEAPPLVSPIVAPDLTTNQESWLSSHFKRMETGKNFDALILAQQQSFLTQETLSSI